MSDPVVPRDLAERLSAAGFTTKRTSRGHVLIYAPDGTFVTCSPGTTSDWRSSRNLRAALRRAGLSGL